jgi:hypothetical protein
MTLKIIESGVERDMTPQEEAAMLADWAATAALPPRVPQAVTMRQARRALRLAGLYDAIQPAIDALPEPQRTDAQIEWDYSSEVQRHNAFVGMLAGALALDDAALDALFIAAGAIP